MPAYLKNAPIGFPGGVSRPDVSNLEPAKFAEADIPSVYGFPVIFVAGAPTKWGSGNVAVDFQGILARAVPQIGGTLASDESISGSGVPQFEQVQDLLVRGYMVVHVAAGTPARGGVVYVQSTANGGVNPGEFRADGTDSGNAVALSATQAEWASDGKDADGMAEIRVAR